MKFISDRPLGKVIPNIDQFVEGLRRAGCWSGKISDGPFHPQKKNQLTGEEIKTLLFGSNRGRETRTWFPRDMIKTGIARTLHSMRGKRQSNFLRLYCESACCA